MEQRKSLDCNAELTLVKGKDGRRLDRYSLGLQGSFECISSTNIPQKGHPCCAE
jgi:hypothetical protein